MNKVLVTGAGGFIGSHLTAHLASLGETVVALDLDLSRVEHLEERFGVTLLEGDVADPQIQRRAVADVDAVFHLAAAHLGVSSGGAEFHRVNVDGVRTLIDTAAEAGIGRFVHCSSVGVFGRVQHPPADENTPCRPDLLYEETKLAGEKLVLEAAYRGRLAAVILRPVWVYGPGCARTERLFRAVARRRFVIAGSGAGMRHCVYIRDLVRAFCLARRADRALGQVVVIGDAGAVTVRRLVAEVARITGSPPPRSVPVPAFYVAALLAEALFRLIGREPPLSRRTLRFFNGNTSFDISRARRLLGYEPQYDLRFGLEETYRYLNAEGSWTVPLEAV